MRFVFKATNEIWHKALSALMTVDGKENAGVFLCGVADLGTEYQFLAQEFNSVPAASYADRSEYHLEVAPSFYNSMINSCLKDELALVIVHSHPTTKEAWYSASDDFGEGKLLPVLASLLPGRRVASLLVSRNSSKGRLREKDEFISIEKIRILGNQVRAFDSGGPWPNSANIF